MNSREFFQHGSLLRIAGVFRRARFLRSALIFWAEPMVGKQLLPLVGGAPAVWNICLLFFQLTARRIRLCTRRCSVAVSGDAGRDLYQPGVVGLAGPSVRFSANPSVESPALWLLGQLTVELGLPFVALAAAVRCCSTGMPLRPGIAIRTCCMRRATRAACSRCSHFQLQSSRRWVCLRSCRIWTVFYGSLIVLLVVAGGLAIRSWQPLAATRVDGDQPTPFRRSCSGSHWRLCHPVSPGSERISHHGSRAGPAAVDSAACACTCSRSYLRSAFCHRARRRGCFACSLCWPFPGRRFSACRQPIRCGCCWPYISSCLPG